MAKLISKTYGEALFELAGEENKTDQFLEEVQMLSDGFKKNPELYKLLRHPKISKEEKIQVMEEICRDRVSRELTGFLTIIISKERNDQIDAIFDDFIQRVKDAKGIGIANVVTAVKLSEIQKKSVEEKLLETTSYKEMEMHYSVDPKLIGGMVIRIKDRVVDSSIRTKLSEIEKQLYKIQLG